MWLALAMVSLAAIPDGFQVAARPTSQQAIKANQGDLWWQVSLDGAGRVVVSKLKGSLAIDTGPKLPFTPQRDDPKYTPNHVLEVEDGYLVGTDQGEWGGGLALYSKDGKRRATLAETNTHCVVRLGSEVVTLHGLNHLEPQAGEVRFWRLASGKATLLETRTLDSGPVSFAVSGDTLFTFTLGGLWRIQGHEVKKVHGVDRSLGALVPGTMVVDASGDIWVGMPAYVLHLMKQGDGYTEQWLRKP